MNSLEHRAAALTLVLGLVAGFAGCDDFVDVTNPNSLEAEAIDPERDGPMLSESVYQDFIATWGTKEDGGFPVYIAWFTNEARVGDTFPTRNSVGRRDLSGGTNAHIEDIWEGVHETIQFARTVGNAIAPAGNSIHLARTWFASGFSILLMAENFCRGTIAESTSVARGPMTTVELLDSAIVHLEMVQSIAQDVGSAADDFAMAAQVGIARAHLQAGRNAEAAAAAAQVPDDFEYSIWHIDDSANRSLGNAVWQFSEARVSLVVGPEWRAIADAGDPRIAYFDEGVLAQDKQLQFYRQDKYQGWGDDERLASGLEARYIEAEAELKEGDNTAALALIDERRLANGGTAYTGDTSDAEVLAELMYQRALDFWLEGKRLADWRRNGDAVPFIIPPGDDTYYKSDLGPVRDLNCWPVPQDEILANPGAGW